MRISLKAEPNEDGQLIHVKARDFLLQIEQKDIKHTQRGSRDIPSWLQEHKASDYYIHWNTLIFHYPENEMDLANFL